MSPDDLQSLAALCSLFLVIWELIRRQYPGAILGGLAFICLVFVTAKVGTLFAIILAIPVVVEERWHSRAEKDLVRGVLAAGIIAPSVAFLLYG